MMTSRVRIKICGITNQKDALAVAQLGADAIGLVFYPESPRNVSVETAAIIARQLPAFINVVGLFVDAEQSFIEQVLEQVAIDTLQFHGQETEQTCALYGKPYIKAIRVGESAEIQEVISRYPSANAVLLDTFIKDVPGGTGVSFDWNLVPENADTPIILAGGLTAENVQSAIRKTRPYAVDVSGGVEQAKGKKDLEKVNKFIREALNA